MHVGVQPVAWGTPSKDGGKEKEKNHLTIRRTLRQFSNHCTAHGFGHVHALSRTSPAGACAFLGLTLFGLSIAAVGVARISRDHFAGNKTFSQVVVEQAGPEGQPMPTVMVCNSGIFRNEVFEDDSIDEGVLNFIVATLKGPLMVTDTFRRNDTLQRALRSSYDSFVAGFDNDFAKMLSSLSYACEDLILGCFNIHLFMGSGDCCRTFLTPTITPSGICFWGNFTPIFNQRMETAQTGLSLMLSSPRGTAAFDFDIVQDDFFTISSGLTLSLLSNVTQPSIHINEVIPIGSGDHVSVAVDYSVMDNRGLTKGMWPWSQPTCVPTSSPRRLLLNTSANCLSNNIFGSLVRYGNCLPLMASKDLFPGGDRLKPCLIDDMIEIPAKSGGASPSCPEICDAEEFRSRVVSAPLKAGFSAWAQEEDHPAHGLFGHAASARRSAAGREIDNSTLSLVTVYYPSLTYRKIIQSRPNLEMWFSSVGGHIGICLGASVISAIEILGLVFTVSLLLFRKVFQTLCSC